MNLYPVFKKELKTYFISPIAYVVILIFNVITGFIFYALFAYYSLISMRYAGYPYPYFTLTPEEMLIRPLFHNMAVTSLFVLPLLTMRLFSEEKRIGTIELLFTYPLKDPDIYWGKFLSCFFIFFIMILIPSFYIFILEKWINYDKMVILNSYFGLLLLGASFISIGIFISSLTESQVVSAIITFGISLLFWIIGWISEIVGPKYAKFFEFISIYTHYENFPKGIFDTRDLVFYLSIILFFSFLTLRILISKKYRG
ncbi:MAG: ABC transporter permease [Candidatus Omnitrophica bacterium]|nr:ABC transporter permease [Candidatus Omnitrophota bacterium]MCM8807433.1 ABC transporter permease [Candidatus Omnitrophota bacterium]